MSLLREYLTGLAFGFGFGAGFAFLYWLSGAIVWTIEKAVERLRERRTI